MIASLLVVDSDDVASGWGWELVTGVGVATWIAHLFAEVLGNHVRSAEAHKANEVRRAAVDGLPILLAAVLPGATLALGSVGAVAPRQALWIAVIAALLQLVALGAFVGVVVPDGRNASWHYAAATAALGVAVVLLLVALGH